MAEAVTRSSRSSKFVSEIALSRCYHTADELVWAEEGWCMYSSSGRDYETDIISLRSCMLLWPCQL